MVSPTPPSLGRQIRSSAGRFFRWRPFRYIVPPTLIGLASGTDDWRIIAALLVPGLSFDFASKVLVDRHTRSQAEIKERNQAEKRRVDGQKEIFEFLIDLVTGIEVLAPKPAGRLRANLMLPVPPNNDVVQIAYSTPGYDIRERRLRWAPHQGTVGAAWATGLYQTAPTAERDMDDWNMTQEQIDATKAVKMVLSLPIMFPERPNDVVAVLSVDDTVPPGAFREAIKATLENGAPRVCEHLRNAGLGFPT